MTDIAAHSLPDRAGVLLMNTGTPAAPTAAALRPYLAEFLGDPRVIELPRWLWLPVLHLGILTTRPARSARLYARVWTPQGSPLLLTMRAVAETLQAELSASAGQEIPVAIGMRYGQPSIATALRELRERGVRRLLALPLFPQYSATTTAAVLDAVFAELRRWRWMPELRTISHYHTHPRYLAALAATVREAWAAHGRPERLLFSFHGLPRSYFLKGDPYYCECQRTAREVAAALGLAAGEWQVTFQSRFGPVEWLRPYTDEVLAEGGRAGQQGTHVICPGFALDCLETLDEIAHEGRRIYEGAGGQGFHYIPALNTRADHLAALADLARAHLAGWLDQPAIPPPDPAWVAERRPSLGL